LREGNVNTAFYVYRATGEHNAVEEQKEVATLYAVEHNLSIVSVYQQEFGDKELGRRMGAAARKGQHRARHVDPRAVYPY
jgi:hypothetical protein